MNLYLETYSGIAGDMTIAALLDLGAEEAVLRKALASMEIGDYELHIEKVKKQGIAALHFDVHIHEHTHHHHGEEHGHHHHAHEHHHRHLADVIAMINKADMSEKAKADAKAIFEIIARAEAKAHDIDIEKVHFHEVGAIDSIVDIVGTAVLMDNLGVEHVYASDLYEGRGYVHCAHGKMPVPVPAVTNICMEAGLALHIIEEEGEHVTPTGAAIYAYYQEGKPENGYVIKNLGQGAGTKDFKESTNLLRVMEIAWPKKKA